MHTEHDGIVVILAKDSGGEHGVRGPVNDDIENVVTGAPRQLREGQGATGSGGEGIDGRPALQILKGGESEFRRAVGRAARRVVDAARASASQSPIGLLIAPDEFIGARRAADEILDAGKAGEGAAAVGSGRTLQIDGHGGGAARVDKGIDAATAIDYPADRARRSDIEAVRRATAVQLLEAGEIEFHRVRRAHRGVVDGAAIGGGDSPLTDVIHAGKTIGSGGPANEGLDVGYRADRSRARILQVDGDRRRTRCIAQDIDAALTIDSAAQRARGAEVEGIGTRATV